MNNNLKLMPPPKAKDAKGQVMEMLREARVKDILVIYRNPEGNFDMLTNQADAAGSLFFLEQFKLELMEKYRVLSKNEAS